MPPKSRGDRDAFTVRPPADQGAVYREHAEKLGIPVGSYATMRLAEADGLPIPGYVLEEIEKAKLERAAAAEQRKQQQLSGLEEEQRSVATARARAAIARKERPLARSA